MAFEKMTEGALYDKFIKLFPNIIGEKCDKIGARMLRIETCGGPVLYFLWYDENNWNLGTKPYRNRPKKQIYSQVRKDLKDGDSLSAGFLLLITNGNDVITGCNQWENIERTAEAMANQPLEPIDWVKEDPDIPDGCIHVTC